MERQDILESMPLLESQYYQFSKKKKSIFNPPKLTDLRVHAEERKNTIKMLPRREFSVYTFISEFVPFPFHPFNWTTIVNGFRLHCYFTSWRTHERN